MAGMIIAGYMMVLQGRNGLYLGLILVWAVPFAFLLWFVSEYDELLEAISDKS